MTTLTEPEDAGSFVPGAVPETTENQKRSTRLQMLGNIVTILFVTGIAATIGVYSSLSIGTGWRAYTVHGGSMEPHYAQGDLIITSSVNAANIEPGQIIVFTADWASEKYEQRVVHRVAAVGTIDGLPIAYTRGDANSIADPQPVDLTGDNVSMVRFSLSNGSFWLELLTAPYALAGILAATGIAVAGLAISRGLPSFEPRKTHWFRSKGTDTQGSSTQQQEQVL